MKPSVSICVPLMISANAPMRARNWRVIANELSALADRRSDVEIVAAEWGGNYAEGYKHIKRVEGQGEFSRSKSRNLAARIAASDLLCFLDTDMVMHPEGWDYAIEAAQRYDAFSPHRQYWRVGREAAEAMIDESERFRFSPHIRNFCPGIKPIRFAFAGGIVFIKRETLDRVGGWDEGFLGWGAEDTALCKLMRAARCTMGRGSVSRPLHLFHEVNHTANKQSAHHFRRYYGRRRFWATYSRKVRLQSAFEAKTRVVTCNRHPPMFVCPDYPSKDEGNHPPITDFVAVTSLSQKSHHLDRQAECLDTWKAFGLEIVAVNSTSEIAGLRPVYPQVDHWHVCDEKTTGFKTNNTPRITSLTDVAIERDQPILLLNSDIEIHGAQSRLLDAIAPGCMTIGIRHNYDSEWWRGSRERSGLDAFYLDPDFARSLPRLELGIGKPAWDYWLPLHAIRSGIPTRWIGYGLFFHKIHELLWSRRDRHLGCVALKSAYGPNADSMRRLWPFGRDYKASSCVGIPVFKTDIPVPSKRNAVCVVCIGATSEKLARVTLPQIAAYAHRCDADLVAIRDDQCPDFPILNKFRVGDVGRRYDRTLFIDIDVFVRDDAQNLFELLPAGKVYRYNETPEINIIRDKGIHDGERERRDVASLAATTGIQAREIQSLSTGVVLFDREHSAMWDAPASYIERFHTVEQVWVNLRSLELDLPLGDLPREFNTQCWMQDYMSYFESAQFIHVVGSTNKLLEVQRVAEMANAT
jgi:GT2 family glycosyltransferase